MNQTSSHTPASDCVEHSIELRRSSIDELGRLLAGEPGTLYAILDACSEPKVPAKFVELGERAVSLYSGSAEENYWAVAPYLVEVDLPLLQWLVAELWQSPWVFSSNPQTT